MKRYIVTAQCEDGRFYLMHGGHSLTERMTEGHQFKSRAYALRLAKKFSNGPVWYRGTLVTVSYQIETK